jgi:hypothetical protein
MTAGRAELEEFEPNPAWVNRSLAESWDAMQERVGKELMPTEKVGSSGKRRSVEEYGCGHYGCVLPTSRKGLVLKVTSDPLEAHFVASAMKMRAFPDGIVHYAAIYRLPAEYRGRPVFVLWREEAYDVGRLVWLKNLPGEDPRAMQEFVWHLRVFQTCAGIVKDIVTRAADQAATLASMKRYEDWARDKVELDDIGEGMGRQHWEGQRAGPFGTLKGAQRAAALVRACAIVAELMEHEPGGPEVGEALDFYLERGLLLADVHLNNVGHVRRDTHERPFWAITDPGHAVPLSQARDAVTVNVLE